MSLIDIVDALFEPQNLWDPATKKNTRNTLAQYQKSLWRGPQVDLYPVDGGVELQADLPGLDKKDIELSVEKETVTISGERQDARDIEQHNFHYSERTFGKFSRAVRLPFSADPATVSARFDNGVLTVNIPQPESTKAGVIAIE